MAPDVPKFHSWSADFLSWSADILSWSADILSWSADVPRVSKKSRWHNLYPLTCAVSYPEGVT